MPAERLPVDGQKLHMDHVIRLIAAENPKDAKPDRKEIIDWARQQLEK